MSSKTASVVPKYRHHKGSGQAFVQVNGHRHYLSKWNTQASKERYAAFVAELAVNPVCAAVRPTSVLSVVELIEAYWVLRGPTIPRGASRQAPLKVFGDPYVLFVNYTAPPRPTTSARWH